MKQLGLFILLYNKTAEKYMELNKVLFIRFIFNLDYLIY